MRQVRRQQQRPPGPDPATFVGLVGFAVIAVALLWLTGAIGEVSGDAWTAMIVAPILVILTVPLARRLALYDEDPALFWIVMVAVVVKLGGALARHVVAFDLYGGGADAGRYHLAGVDLAEQFRDGIFEVPGLSGTAFIKVVTGAVYAATGPSRLAGFLVFSWLGFLGLVLYTRAIRHALPNARHRFYDILVLFLPSMVFWPSSIGKEAWMTLTLGLCAYGAARFLSGRGGILVLALGMAGTAFVRPHVTVIVALALLFAYPFRGARRATQLNPVVTALGLVILLGVAGIVIVRAQEFLGIERLNTESVTETIEKQSEATDTGGSSFEGGRVENVTDVPRVVVTILFRPFPYEVDTGAQVLSSLEGLLLLGLFLAGIARIARAPLRAARNAYVAFVLVYSAVFILGFAGFENFGLLVRQRVQLLPFIFVLLIPERPAADDRVAREDDRPTTASS